MAKEKLIRDFTSGSVPKQLLRFAALKQHRDGKEDWS